MDERRKPKLTSAELVEKMKVEKGITFKYISETEAEYYLREKNNYMRTASYRKNYQKYQRGANEGKYINLDFKYLTELSTLDMHFRNIILLMCIDVEHALKVKLISDAENDGAENGYELVKRFLDFNPDIVKSICTKSKSPFLRDLIKKYFVINKVYSETCKSEYVITDFTKCPVWVIVELLTYGEFIKLYKLYYGDKAEIDNQSLNFIRALRNGAAHNSCMLANLNRKESYVPVQIKKVVKSIDGISKSKRQKCLTTRTVLEFTALLYVYGKVVSEKVAKHQCERLKWLFFDRMLENAYYFENNDLIRSNYKFACEMIKSLL